jgi:hypothetical protein
MSMQRVALGSARGICNPEHVMSSWRIAALPLAVVWAWAMSLVIVGIPAVIAWATAPDDVTVDPITRGANLWALAMAPAITLGQSTISLMPWGFTLVWFALLWAGTRWAMGFAPGLPARILGFYWIGSVVITAGLAFVVTQFTGPELQISPGVVAWHAALVAGAAMALAIGMATRTRLMPYVPDVAQRTLRGIVLAVLGIAVVAAAVLIIAMVRSTGEILEVWRQLQPGAMGSFLLFVLQLGYVPVLLGWAAAYLTGAGIVVGEQATISPFIATTSAVDLPPVPILAALPTSASMVMWILPLSVMGVGAWAVHRAVRTSTLTRLHRLAVAGGVALGTSLVMALWAVMSGGALGSDRLAHVGPTPSVVAWLTFGLIGIGGALVAVLAVPRVPAPPPVSIVPDPTMGSDSSETEKEREGTEEQHA